MGLFDLVTNMSPEKKAALGLTAAAGIASFYAGITDEKRQNAALEEVTRQAAYKAGSDQAKMYYATKGNPKAMRNAMKKNK